MEIVKKTGVNAQRLPEPNKSNYEYGEDYNEDLKSWREFDDSIDKKIRECVKHDDVKEFILGPYHITRTDGKDFAHVVCKNCGEMFHVVLEQTEMDELRKQE